MVYEIYQKLYKIYGPQKWWPASGFTKPKEWEICVGAVLTQNTNWSNVEKALENMRKAKINTAGKIIQSNKKDLEEIIKPSGFYKQKADHLKILAKFAMSFGSVEKFLKKIEREELLKVKGIGPETADSILLYAAGKPYFVIDAYTKRIFSRMGFFKEDIKYEAAREFFEKRLKKDAKLYNEFHALIVRFAKDVCRKKPMCADCFSDCKLLLAK